MKRPRERKRLRTRESGEGIRSLHNSTTADCTIIIIIITRKRRAIQAAAFIHVDGKPRRKANEINKQKEEKEEETKKIVENDAGLV